MKHSALHGRDPRELFFPVDVPSRRCKDWRLRLLFTGSTMKGDLHRGQEEPKDVTGRGVWSPLVIFITAISHDDHLHIPNMLNHNRVPKTSKLHHFRCTKMGFII